MILHPPSDLIVRYSMIWLKLICPVDFFPQFVSAVRPTGAYRRFAQQHKLEQLVEHRLAKRHAEHQPQQHEHKHDDGTERHAAGPGVAVQNQFVYTRTAAMHHRQGSGQYVSTVSAVDPGARQRPASASSNLLTNPPLFRCRYGNIISTKAILDKTTNKCKGWLDDVLTSLLARIRY